MHDPKLTFTSKYSYPKDFPLFQFSTTVVDLKPFNTGQNDRHNSTTPDLNASRNETASAPNKSKQYLINKKLSFYEPVKDAEMLAHLNALRLKLHNKTSLKKSNSLNRHLSGTELDEDKMTLHLDNDYMNMNKLLTTENLKKLESQKVTITFACTTTCHY